MQYFSKNLFKKSSLKDFYREGKGGRERGRETFIDRLSQAPRPGIKPSNQVCAFTGSLTQPHFGLRDDAPNN